MDPKRPQHIPTHPHPPRTFQKCNSSVCQCCTTTASTFAHMSALVTPIGFCVFLTASRRVSLIQICSKKEKIIQLININNMSPSSEPEIQTHRRLHRIYFHNNNSSTLYTTTCRFRCHNSSGIKRRKHRWNKITTIADVACAALCATQYEGRRFPFVTRPWPHDLPYAFALSPSARSTTLQTSWWNAMSVTPHSSSCAHLREQSSNHKLGTMLDVLFEPPLEYSVEQPPWTRLVFWRSPWQLNEHSACLNILDTFWATSSCLADP